MSKLQVVVGSTRPTRLADLVAWWSHALERARAQGELIPGAFRAQAAIAASPALAGDQPA